MSEIQEKKQYIKAEAWDTGEVITKEKMNDISNALAWTSEEIYNAVDGRIIQNNGNDILSRKLDGLVKFFNEEPNSDDLTYNRLYVYGDTQNSQIEVPTMADYEKFKQFFVEKYSSEKSYSAGDYFEHEDSIYKVLTDIAANSSLESILDENSPKAREIEVMKEVNNLVNVYTGDNPPDQSNRIWINTSHESIQVPTMDEFNNLKNIIHTVSQTLSWEQGAISSETGNNTTSSSNNYMKRIRTHDYSPVSRQPLIVAADEYKYCVFLYSGTGAKPVYQGMLQADGSLANTAFWLTGVVYLSSVNPEYYYRLVLATFEDTNITVEDGVNLTAYLATDDTLTVSNVPADAAAVGLLKSQIIALNSGRALFPSTFERGTITNSGTVTFDNKRIRSTKLFAFDEETTYIIADGFEVKGVRYNKTTGAYVNQGEFNTKSFTFNNENAYRVVIKRVTEDTSEIADINEFANALYRYPVDTTLSKANVPADAKAVSDKIETEKMAMANATLFDFGAWAYGDINSSNGVTRAGRKATRLSCMTRIEPIKNIVLYNTNPDLKITIYYYGTDETSSFKGITELTGEGAINVYDGIETYGDAKYFRLTLKYVDDGAISDFKELCKSVKANIPAHDLYIHDEPRSKGVAAMVQRSSNMVNIAYVLSNDLPQQWNEKTNKEKEDDTDHNIYKVIERGTFCRGMKYSSTRSEQLFVPQAVSFETFASAVLNPNSYLYTRVEQTSDNGRTYYGAVCSTMVAYCLGITDSIPTTISFMNYLEKLPDYMQNPYSLQIGYILNKRGSHINIVTDIIRNIAGKIIYVELSEASHPYMDTRWWTPEEAQERTFDLEYELCWYPKIDTISPDDISNFMYIDNSLYNNGTLNPNLAPRRGDKANWRAGETIEIDILERGSFTKYKLFQKNGTEPLRTVSIGNSNLIKIADLSPGKYKLCLTDDQNDSGYVYFDIIATTESYTVDDDTVTVTYDSNFGTASAILFINNNDNLKSTHRPCPDYLAIRHFHVLTDNEVTAGQTTVNKPALENLEYNDEGYEAPNGVWKMRVVYKTEYGLYCSDFYDVNFQSDGSSGTLVPLSNIEPYTVVRQT